LGVCYEEGIGVVKDYVLAKQWYKEAAQQGRHPAATNNLGHIYVLEVRK
jgi:TPR repeat protein